MAALRSNEHEPTPRPRGVEHAVTHPREDGVYRPVCACGWRGAGTSIESLSLAQGAAHLRGVNR